MESDKLDQADQKMTDIIQHQCMRVNSIVENVLQLSRRRTAMIQRLRVDQWVQSFVQDFVTAHDEPCDINLSGLHPCWVQVDPTQLSQILTNLIENGLRYSVRQTGQASLILRSGELPGSALPYLEVIDHGPGIAESALARLFEPFYTSENKGTGLGLYIARELCEMNHASLSYIQRTGKGACFRITFAHPNRLLAS